MLSVLPCKDKEESVSAQSGTRIEVSHASGNVHPEDACPPFCNCTCCGVFKTFPVHITFIGHTDTVIPVNFSVFKVSFPKEISLSFWQPPRLA